MNWSKLPKEKRQNLILVVLVTLVAVVALGYGLIGSQYRGLASLKSKQSAARAKLKQMENAVQTADKLAADLEQASKKLTAQEEQMASGDYYTWLVYTTIREFRQGHNLDIPQFSNIIVGDVDMIPDFPYRQVAITIGGTGYYHDIGRFVAEFENQFPQMRIVGLDITVPGDTASGGDKEKLSFKMDIVALIRPVST